MQHSNSSGNRQPLSSVPAQETLLLPLGAGSSLPHPAPCKQTHCGCHSHTRRRHRHRHSYRPQLQATATHYSLVTGAGSTSSSLLLPALLLPPAGLSPPSMLPVGDPGGGEPKRPRCAPGRLPMSVSKST